MQENHEKIDQSPLDMWRLPISLIDSYNSINEFKVEYASRGNYVSILAHTKAPYLGHIKSTEMSWTVIFLDSLITKILFEWFTIHLLVNFRVTRHRIARPWTFSYYPLRVHSAVPINALDNESNWISHRKLSIFHWHGRFIDKHNLKAVHRLSMRIWI